MLYVGCVLIIVICSILSIRAKLLLVGALWLAVTSAVVAALLYGLGAHEIAVIELSVGAGLVTVLFVFAISLMGGASSFPASIIPKPLAYGLALVCALLLGLMVLPAANVTEPTASSLSLFTHTLWEDRGLDMLVQIVLIFAGVLSILNLLATVRRPVETKTSRPAENRLATSPPPAAPEPEKEYI